MIDVSDLRVCLLNALNLRLLGVTKTKLAFEVLDFLFRIREPLVDDLLCLLQLFKFAVVLSIGQGDSCTLRL